MGADKYLPQKDCVCAQPLPLSTHRNQGMALSGWGVLKPTHVGDEDLFSCFSATSVEDGTINGSLFSSPYSSPRFRLLGWICKGPFYTPTPSKRCLSVKDRPVEVMPDSEGLALRLVLHL